MRSIIAPKVKNLIYIMIFLFYVSESFASGVGKDMEKLFNTLGGGANYTEGASFRSQSAGYYTGGTLYARVPVQNYQFANFQAPSFKAGCGGIDIFSGSFSYINSEEMVKAMRGVMSNAVGYSFNLALQTFVPQVYNTMQKLNDIAREINNLNMNSCETTAQTLGAVWPKNDMASKQLCQSMGTSNGKFGDWARARQECGVGGKRHETNSVKPDKFEHQLGDEFNMTWEAIKNQQIFVNNKELAEFFMSVSGTIIGRKNEENSTNTHYFASLINNDILLDVFLYGSARSRGGAILYECKDKERCLQIDRKTLNNITEKQGLVPQIENLLRSMAIKMRNHSGQLTEEEKSLIELTQIPILKIIAVQNAFMVGNAVINIHEYAEPIAYDYLLGYLENILDFVSVNLSQLEKVQMGTTHVEEFKKEISTVRKIITNKRFGAYQRMLASISVIEKTNIVEKKMQNMFANYSNITD